MVVPADRVDAATEIARAQASDLVNRAARAGGLQWAQTDRIRVVSGGASRQASVAAGLAALLPSVDIVLVHDAARALTPPEVFDRVAAAVHADAGVDVAGAIPVLPVVDTLKRVDGATIVAGVDRAEFAAAQTPQGFRREVLDVAYRAAQTRVPVVEYTDDAALIAASGHRVQTVAGAPESFKITTVADLDRARMMLVSSDVASAPTVAAESLTAAAQNRVGIGTDVHGFGGGGTLWLAGLEWPGEPALSGHSDGDAVAHAIVDAVLSAAGLGDIGTRFGTDQPEYRGAHADAFLAETARLVRADGWQIVNVSVQVQAVRPRFAARKAEAEAALSAALGGAVVSVSATTTDGLGFTGRGEGVAAFAVAMLTRSAP